MLKLGEKYYVRALSVQPPSGGCVLKRRQKVGDRCLRPAAAFGRLCVETVTLSYSSWLAPAAAFGRLCVETNLYGLVTGIVAAAAFGRLCVETWLLFLEYVQLTCSRLRAAVC